MNQREKFWLRLSLTMHDCHDGKVIVDILDGIDAEITQVSADGAYDHRHCYDEVTQHSPKAVITPRKDAKILPHGKTMLLSFKVTKTSVISVNCQYGIDAGDH
ncbi:transposase, IS4 family [Pseudanabaena sp. ABRG5-3]|nr:transposase, IS4 family [Pseudanabaena sp. ABRG5-3]